MILCWSAKGGSGTTVVACSLALSLAHHGGRAPAALSWYPVRARRPHRPVHDVTERSSTWPHLIDLAGDVPLVLGAASGQEPGVLDWMASSVETTQSLWSLAQPAGPGLRYIPRGGPCASPSWERLAGAIKDSPTVVDCGTGLPPRPLVEAARHSLLVTRACYLSLRKATSMADAATGIVLVREPGRALRLDDIERALGRPVVSTIDVDPRIARAVDAGLAISRLPRTLTHVLADTMARAG